MPQFADFMARTADELARYQKEVIREQREEIGLMREHLARLTKLYEQRAETLQQELRSERTKRPLAHTHDPDDPEPVLVFDLNQTLTPFNGGFPISPFWGANADPFPKVKSWLDRWAGRGACLHLATAGLWPQVRSEPDVFRARVILIDAWVKSYGLPISLILPKIDSDVFYDDRMIVIPENPDWDVIGQQAEQSLDQRFYFRDGKYVRKPKVRSGQEIKDFPNYNDVPLDHPRAYTTPVVDVDMHRTLSLASSSLRVDAPKPDAIESLRTIYDAGYTIHVSCAGWNPATHTLEDSQRRLAAMRQWLYDYGVPYDQFVTKDHGDLYFDDKGLTATTWKKDLPTIMNMLKEKMERTQSQQPAAEGAASR